MYNMKSQTSGTALDPRPTTHRNPYQALAAITEAGEERIRRENNRWDTAGDVLALLGGLIPLAACFATVVFSHGPTVPSIFAALVFTLLFIMAAVFCWLHPNKVQSSEDILALGLSAIGGPGSLPAGLADRFSSKVLRTANKRYLELADLSSQEEETFRLLHEEGFAGTLGELVGVSRSLNRL